MVCATLLIALATAASAAELTGFRSNIKSQKNLLPTDLSSNALNFAAEGACSTSEKVCDSNFCIASSAICCGDGNGAFCERGRVCVANGCCPLGQTCTGPPTCENDDEKICGTFCIPQDADCCNTVRGTFCEAPGTCTSSGCSTGSLRGGTGGSGGSSGGGSSDGGSGGGSSGGGSSGGGSSGGSGGGSNNDGPQCFNFEERCNNGCMPQGELCCGNYNGGSDRRWCYSWQICEDDGTCSRKGGFGETDGGDDDDDDNGSGSLGGGGGSGGGSSSDTTGIDGLLSLLPSTTSTSNSLSASGSANSIFPTGVVGGGPDDDAPRSGGGSANDENSPDDTDAAMVHGPSLFAAVVALIPLLL